jgi:hypothetical protein
VKSDGVGGVKIAGWVLLSVVSAWVLVGCGGGQPPRQPIAWPEGSGYLSEAKNRPSSPPRVESSTKAQIIAVGEGRIRLGPNSKLALINSRPLLFAPGAEVSYLSTSPDKFEFKDYNGDACLLPAGITIWVNEYGQFVPISYRPGDGVAPPTGPPTTQTKVLKGGPHADPTGMTVFSGVIGGEQFVKMNEL